MIAHKLTNILSVISGHVHLAEAETLPEDARCENFEQIEQSVHRALILVERIEELANSTYKTNSQATLVFNYQ
ncbi:histidine kinase dimerization/phospho-acceptor domain-containing protein [Bremerella cremea]|nr:histidine kinase dimerization/phospho-acceptor domain-containing protein [Bremerella cremea]